MKCQHGESISKFCISEDCVRKGAGGCLQCFKRNHLHLAHVEILNLDQVGDLINKLRLKENKKNKQSSLKQLLKNYFQGLKTQVNRSLEMVCQSMMDRISHAYLFNQGVLQTFKRIQAKDFRKISARELRHLYLLNEKNPEVDLQREEERYYNQEVIKIHSTIESIKRVFDQYQVKVSSYDRHFSADSFFYNRIIELTDKIAPSKPHHSFQKQIPKGQSKPLNSLNNTFKKNRYLPNDCKEQKREDQSLIETKYEAINSQRQDFESEPLKIRITQKLKDNPENEILNRSFQETQQPKLLSLAEYKNERTRSSAQIESKHNLNLQLLNVKGSKQRKFSVNMERLSPIDKNRSQDGNSTTNRSILSIQVRSPIQKIQALYKKDVSQLKLKNHSYKIQEDQIQNQFYIQVLDPKINQDLKSDRELSLLNGEFQCKQCISEVFPAQSQEEKNKSQTPYFTKNFNQEIRNQILKPDVPNNQIRTKSSLLNKKLTPNSNPLNFQLRKSYSAENKEGAISIIRKLLAQTASQENQNMNYPQDEVISVFLLLESLNFSSQQAIQYLRKSFQYCPSNLSTAEYLSYLLLEKNHPKQCLELCNYILTQMKGAQNFNLSVHILNNKASALNLLGRFSESIQFVQKVIGNHEKDSLYKNLGDSYNSLGIIEKSIINYQKCLSLNNQHDQAYYNLAVCFYVQHHYAQALQMVSEAIRLNSERDEYCQLYRHTKPKVG